MTATTQAPITPTTTTTAVSVDGLTKRFGSTTAVSAISFDIPTGVVAGFIGPNGAGKTTTMAMLLGLVAPSGGTATVLGHPVTRPTAYLDRVGALIEGPALWPGMTGRQNLRSLAALGGHNPHQIPDLIELVGLTERENDRYGGYSLGMKQRLGIAAALLGDPALLVLDEPSNGLDPAGMSQMRQLIADLGRDDRTVLVSSHLLGDLEQICDWLIVIDKGAVLYQGPAADFLGQAVPVVIAVPEFPADLDRLVELARADGLETAVTGDGVSVSIDGPTARDVALTLNRAAINKNIVLAELSIRWPDLESHYLAQIQGENR